MNDCGKQMGQNILFSYWDPPRKWRILCPLSQRLLIDPKTIKQFHVVKCTYTLKEFLNLEMTNIVSYCGKRKNDKKDRKIILQQSSKKAKLSIKY